MCQTRTLVQYMRISVPDKGVFLALTLTTANAAQLNHETRFPIQVKIVHKSFISCSIF